MTGNEAAEAAEAAEVRSPSRAMMSRKSAETGPGHTLEEELEHKASREIVRKSSLEAHRSVHTFFRRRIVHTASVVQESLVPAACTPGWRACCRFLRSMEHIQQFPVASFQVLRRTVFGWSFLALGTRIHNLALVLLVEEEAGCNHKWVQVLLRVVCSRFPGWLVEVDYSHRWVLESWVVADSKSVQG